MSRWALILLLTAVGARAQLTTGLTCFNGTNDITVPGGIYPIQGPLEKPIVMMGSLSYLDDLGYRVYYDTLTKIYTNWEVHERCFYLGYSRLEPDRGDTNRLPWVHFLTPNGSDFSLCMPYDIESDCNLCGQHHMVVRMPEIEHGHTVDPGNVVELMPIIPQKTYWDIHSILDKCKCVDKGEGVQICECNLVDEDKHFFCMDPQTNIDQHLDGRSCHDRGYFWLNRQDWICDLHDHCARPDEFFKSTDSQSYNFNQANQWFPK